MDYGFYLNRTMCEVLEEIRRLDKTKNYSGLLGLIEEVQIMANRMEAGLSDVKDIKRLYKKRKELRDEVELLKKTAKENKDEQGN